MGRRGRRRKWPVPDDASVVLEMRFNVYAYSPRVYHAEARIEFPTGKCDLSYAYIHKSDKTEYGALRGVIEEIENSKWFHYLRYKGVRFRVSGCNLDELYRGYL